jgi:hypothetical protein
MVFLLGGLGGDHNVEELEPPWFLRLCEPFSHAVIAKSHQQRGVLFFYSIMCKGT